LTTSFGPARLEKFVVWTDEVSDRDLGEAPGRLAPIGWNAASQV
jgi:hypothetical protein